MFQCLRERPALPSDSRLGPWAHGVNQFSWVTRARAEGPQGPPAHPGDLRLGPMDRRVDKQSWATREQVRGPAGWISTPG